MINQSELEIGKCFVTSSKQMRKVIELSNGAIKYEAWSANQEKPKNPNHVTVNIDKFCKDVERAVRCDYRAGFGE